MPARCPVLLPLSLLCCPWLPAQAHWTRLYPAVSPAARTDAAAFTYDTVRQRMLLFGGQVSQINNEFWSFDGANWRQITVPTPPARSIAGMAFDEARGVAVLFGGWGNPYRNDTWEWNGTAWSLRLPAHQPPARGQMAMAYDPVRARTVLFGGFNNSGSVSFFGDTWEWDGQDWQQRLPATAPSARLGAAMAFDPIGGGMLLFGGSVSGGIMDDTWRWDGVDWQPLQPTMLPFFRTLHSMATDTDRQRVVLLGDNALADPYAWEWDGSNWNPRLIPSPSPRTTPGLVYDPARRQICMFGGARNSLGLNDTWVYRTDQPADYVPYGHGCQGSVGTPSLDNAQYSLPWLGDHFTAEVRGAPPGATVVLMTGFYAPPAVNLAPFGMPGCDWFVSNDVPGLLFANAAGVASWSLRVPNLPSVIGAILYQQAFVVDAVNAAGAVVSNAAELHTGVR